jgi:hypothetical protein
MRIRHLVIGILGGAAALAASIVPLSPFATGAPADLGRETRPTGDVAQARASYPGTTGQLNMWQHDGYEGQHEGRTEYDKNLHNDSCSGCDTGPGGNFGDDMSSFVNKTGKYWVIFEDSGWQTYGDFWCIRPYSHDADLGNNGFSNLEDEISSLIRIDSNHASHPGLEQCERYAAGFLGYKN